MPKGALRLEASRARVHDKENGGFHIQPAKPNEVKESIFNAGLAKLERIHKIKIGMIQSSAMDDFKTTCKLLRKFRMELHERMNPEQKTKCNLLQNRMRAALSNYQKRGATTDLIENVIEEFEQYLNELEFEFGMSLPNKADPYGGIAA